MTAPQPSGTVTFLFTDIEGSTTRWEHHRAAMARALDAHNARLLAAMDAHAGFAFKTMGDAFCVAFADPASHARSRPKNAASTCTWSRARRTRRGRPMASADMAESGGWLTVQAWAYGRQPMMGGDVGCHSVPCVVIFSSSGNSAPYDCTHRHGFSMSPPLTLEPAIRSSKLDLVSQFNSTQGTHH